MKDAEIKNAVKEKYAEIAVGKGSCCNSFKSCSDSAALAESVRKGAGYTEKELKSVPDGANLGLGCGNPVALASISKGETVLDLGSGAGFDCFLAAKRVGDNGRVIGVDMTSEMIDKAKENALKGGYGNVEFRQGEIENLPVDDSSVDIIISNCVINLSPDKKSVFQEAYRVLKEEGRLMVSDIVLLAELPDFIKDSVEAYVGCIGGAVKKDEYISAIKEAGFQDIKVIGETNLQGVPAASIKISAVKTRGGKEL